MAETYFDPSDGKLVIGEAAVEADAQSQSMGDYDFEHPPEDVNKAGTQDLPTLLTTRDFPHTRGHYSGQRVYGWTEADTHSTAAWILNQIKTLGETAIRDKHFARLHILGLVPDDRTIRATGGKIWQINRDLDAKGSYSHRDQYRTWTRDDWAAFSKKIDDSINPDGNRHLTREEYVAASGAIHGPSRWQIQRYIGFNRLNELAGRFDPEDKDADDIIEWGSEVHAANPDDPNPLSKSNIESLSAKAAGPSTRLIYKFFDNLPDFQEKARQRAAEKAHVSATTTASLVQKYNQLVRSSPPEPIPSDIPDDRKAAYAAKYELAASLLGTNRQELAHHLAGQPPSKVIEGLTGNVDGLTAGMIEVKASQMGLMDVIWPPARDTSKLRLGDKTQTPKTQHGERHDRSQAQSGSQSDSQSGGRESAPSIAAVQAELRHADELSGRSLEQLQHCHDLLEEAYGILSRATKGSLNYEESKSLFAGAINEISNVRNIINSIRSKLAGLSDRL